MCYPKSNMPIRSGIRLRTLVISPWTAALAASLLVAGCSTAPVAPPSAGHLRAESLAATNPGIPSPVASTVTLPRPKAAAKAESYSVSVRNIPVQDLLFALARDAKLNVDIHPGIEGIVTLNAIDQTLQQILTRIAKQVEMRWDIEGPNLMVTPDTPYLKIYKVDYVNIARTMKGSVSVETAVSTTGGTGKAVSEMTSESKNNLMDSIVKNVTEMLRETDAYIPIGGQSAASSGQVTAAGTGAAQVTGQSSGSQKAVGQNISQNSGAPSVSGSGNQNVAGKSEANNTSFFYREMVSVIPNHETGVLSIRAKKKQHDRIQEFLDNVMVAAKRQVLIEATIAEVELSDNYVQGIEWSRIASGIAGALAGTGSGGTGFAISQAAGGLFTLTGQYTTSSGGTFDGTIALLQKYGNVKVLSSPKLSVLNNQTAMLRVVTNDVYFTAKSEIAPGQNGADPVKAITTTPQTVAVGFVMAVTPQISEGNTITLNVRPSITSIIRRVKDPNPDLDNSDPLLNPGVPVIRTREMESILRIDSGNIVVMGGLMEETLDNTNSGLPALSYMPLFGSLFQSRNDTRKKTELVIFLRPVIIKDASIQGDYSEYRGLLPGQDFFEKDNLGPPLQRLDIGGNPQ